MAYNEDERNKALARAKLAEIKHKFNVNEYSVSHDTMNTMPSYWKVYEEEIKKIDGLEFIDISHPIYSKVTDKQYIFNPEKHEEIRKFFSRALNELLQGAESLIDAIDDLNEKTLSEDDLKLRQRKLKLIELLIKTGRIDFEKALDK